jgi:hypothetical protein
MGWDWVHWVRRLLGDLLYQPRLIDECSIVSRMRIGRGKRDSRRICAQYCFVHHHTEPEQASNQGRRGKKPATNRLSYDLVLDKYLISKRYTAISFIMSISAIWPHKLYFYHTPRGWDFHLGSLGSIPDHFIRHLWWIKGDCGRFFS